jgi:uroporphyrin-III C-methyltransferase
MTTTLGLEELLRLHGVGFARVTQTDGGTPALGFWRDRAQADAGRSTEALLSIPFPSFSDPDQAAHRASFDAWVQEHGPQFELPDAASVAPPPSEDPSASPPAEREPPAPTATPACSLGAASFGPKEARVFLVGAGPGGPGLLTCRARHLLQEADVVVHDALIAPSVLALIPAHAERVNVGKRRGKHLAEQGEIQEVLLDHASRGRRVVRLKGGDPLLFGRGAEEMAALREAGIAYEVVPGIPSPFAAPLMAGIPVTHRDHSSAVTVVTGHNAADHARHAVAWQQLAGTDHTLVILMGLSKLDLIARRLIDLGRPADTPAAVVQEAALPGQQAVYGTLADIADKAAEAGIQAPATIIVGAVAALGPTLRWR